MTFLVIPIGSHGDVHPFIGIARVLRDRGHQVRFLVNPFFGDLAAREGLNVVPIGTADEYLRLNANPDLWHPLKGQRFVFRALGDLLAPTYQAILENHIPGQTVLVSSTLALAARVAQDKLAIPNATVHLQPGIFQSVYETPHMNALAPSADWFPHWVKRFYYWIGKRLTDPLIAPRLNEFRAELGLTPVTSIWAKYWHSPQLVIGLFPEWYAPKQPDWPAQTRLTGFPLYDERGVTPMSDELRRFLDAGESPIAFTFGSAMWHAHELLEQSARTCQLLGRRGILLTRHREQVPPRLPAGVRHFDYAPFSQLLPRCQALVHHGGIGTVAQALSAGVPSLVVPSAHDQPDNARRLERLGVGITLRASRYRADRAAQLLADLTASAQVAENCRQVARRFVGVNPLAETCDLIEALSPAPVNL